MLILFSIAIVFIAAGLLWGHKDPSKWRALVFLFFVFIAFLLALEGMGTPKYYSIASPKERLIVAAEYDPGRWIYIWTRGNPPVAYRLIWSDELAEEIEKGLRAAREKGYPGLIIDGVDYGEMEVHPPPVREAPHKP